jgi:hypothetical protein
VHSSLVVRILETTTICAIMAVDKVSTVRVVVPATASRTIGAVLFVGAVGTGRQVTAICAVCLTSVKVSEQSQRRRGSKLGSLWYMALVLKQSQ